MDRECGVPPSRGRRLSACVLAAATAAAMSAFAQASTADAGASENDFARMSLEELANLDVTSVSKNPEPLSQAAASIFVISRDDIRRSGATRLPEVLRLAPNLQVAEVSASQYAISARGFNSQSANKLLVLIDGRSVYTPLFAGVFWDVQDVLLEDIDRIEVISGPGGTLWGTNAVNGVINIITRSAKQTLGDLVEANSGNTESGGAVRHGAAAGENGDFRVYGKYLHVDATSTAAGLNKRDGWENAQAGFRYDWSATRDDISLEGAAYSGREGQPLPGTIAVSNKNFPLGTIAINGQHLTARALHRYEDGSSLSLLAWFDQTRRDVPPTFSEDLHLFDLEALHTLHWRAGNTFEWGGEYRGALDQVQNRSPIFGFLPGHLTQHWASLFAQDQLSLTNTVAATLGVRFESNPYTGDATLPSARLAWNPVPQALFWTAASRAVRSPSRLDRDTYVPAQPPFVLDGGQNVQDETANVYELGYRGQPHADMTLSATLFHADYMQLRTLETAPSKRLFYFANGMHGHTTGIEAWATWQVARNWRLAGGATSMRERLGLNAGSNNLSAPAGAGSDPANSMQLRSSWDLPASTELDVTVRNVASLANPSVAPYTATDLRVGWRPSSRWALSFSAQNVFDRRHGEFADITTRTQLGREVQVRAVARF